jgi:tetratricopeptide (TPR) repeat protein
VTISDLHDAALYAWRQAGVRDAVLVHVDAHHDADAKEWNFVTIANFVWWGLADGTLREVFWIVPDPSWETTSRRRLIEQALVTLARQHDGSAGVESGDGFVRVEIGGKPFTACRLHRLPVSLEALVDIDVDYFLVPDIAQECAPIERAMPWLWPADLVAALRDARVHPTLVTIATSTRGGFTPLEWKYLGEELCARLSDGDVEPFDVLRAGAEAEHRGELEAADTGYRRAIQLMPQSAGARYRLARVQLRRGNDHAARSTFQEVLDRDPSYRVIDSDGRRWHAERNFAAAARAYRDTLRMDPQNPYASLGLAELAAADGDHAGAIVHFERALRSPDVLVDGHRGLARSLESIGEVGRAIEHYERSIRLELLGHQAIDTAIATLVPRVFDDRHWEVHRRLAGLRHDARWLAAVDRVTAGSSLPS